MRILGSRRQNRDVVQDPATGEVYMKQRPGESSEDFQARMAAAAHEREPGLHPVHGEREAYVEPRRDAAHDQREAYVEGRRDGHRAERRDERAAERPRRRRGGFGLIGVLVVLVAALGVLWMALAAREGSFAAGGAVVDGKLAEVTEPARTAAAQAVDRTGQAVQNAGQTLENKGEQIRETAQ